MFGPPPIPPRITIDFRQTLHPSRGWIIGRPENGRGRVELLAFEEAPEPELVRALSAAEFQDCTCPDFCERDHANE